MTSPSNRRAILVGAGIVGLVSACRLAEAGYDVHIIEQNDQTGEGVSKANAGQLLYDRIGAMGSAGFLRKIPGTLLNPDQGINATGLLNPVNWPWLSEFVGQCTTRAWRNNTEKLLGIAHLSRQSMAKFIELHGIEFDWRNPGKIVVYPDKTELTAARQVAEFQEQFGGRHQILNADECIECEPALVGGSRKIAGGVFLPDAEVGDCHSFCQSLARLLVDRLGGKVTCNVRVTGLEVENGRISALCTNRGRVEGDIFIVATGGDAPKLLSRSFVGKMPIANVKGITLTYPSGPCPPELSVTDAAGKFVVMRLGDQIRVAGYAIFSDNLNIRQDQVERLENKAKALMPMAADYGIQPKIWAGLRPHTPNDLPMIGRAGAENLFVNAGHGSLGWTLAFGSAEILLNKIGSKPG